MRLKLPLRVLPLRHGILCNQGHLILHELLHSLDSAPSLIGPVALCLAGVSSIGYLPGGTLAEDAMANGLSTIFVIRIVVKPT